MAMTPALRTRIRNGLLSIAAAGTVIFWLPVYCKMIRFDTMSMFLSLFPGMPGLWLRRAYYYMTLPNAPKDISVGFGSVITGRNVKLGERVSIGGWCSINDCEISAGTLIGSHVDIFSGRYQHGNFDTLQKDKASCLPTGQTERTVIGENVWIGNGVTCCNSVGEHSIIGTGAVVVKAIPAHSIAVGNPARVMKQKT